MEKNFCMTYMMQINIEIHKNFIHENITSDFFMDKKKVYLIPSLAE